MIRKLIAKEFIITEEDTKPERQLAVGDKYSYFQDPETGRYYRPVEGFIVTAKEDGGDLSIFFEEIN